uniref:Glycine-rich domain-containing protein 1 n=1 Tax=Aegilops tauschii TaxID=37682 RepID=R7W9P0_AEGTA
MDAEQESRWAAAQGIRIGEDLVPAALRHLEFLAAVDRRRWLYDGPLLHRAIRRRLWNVDFAYCCARYKACWLPLLAKHTEAAVADVEPLVVPLDCEWIWHCHRLNPTRYIKDCKRLYGRILDSKNVRSSIQAKSKDRLEKVWTELYPGEPFELEYSGSPSDDSVYVGDETAGGVSYDLISAVKRQSTFVYQVGTPNMHDRRFLEDALARYKGFLYLIKMNQEKGMNLFRVPTYDVDLMWHTHQLNSVAYCNDMLGLLGRVLEHDDTDDDRAEGKKLDTGFSGTTEQFENSFGLRYCKAGAMYRGSLPAPVTSIPQIFSGDDSVSGVDKAEKHLTILETNVVELYVQIVDIKNLPSAIPDKSVYVWYTKTKPDAFIRDGGRLDISSKTGKSIGAGFQCEPTGEIILTVMVDQAYFGAPSSKKSEPLGKVSISLQELTWHDSKLSFERWFELKSGGAYAGSPPVSLRVAASCTVPRQAPQVLSMVNVKPCSLKACLLPHSIRDQNMSSWTRFVYDCGTELIRLQIREHKAKSGMALIRELVGVTKSSKQPLQLAEFTENKWSFNNSNSSITLDLKPSKDGCINELKYDNKLIRLYRGRRLAYELKCCSQHAEDTAAVTAVKFSAEHPYGKAVALVDTESEFITVDEEWFLLPWIAISFLFLNSIGKDGAKLIEGAMVPKAETVEPDTTVVSQTVKGGAAGVTAGSAQCGACGTAGGGDMVMASDKAGHATYGSSVTASGKVADSKCGGCGSGCGGGCGVPVVTMSYKNGHANCGIIAGGENGHIEYAGCGSGCGGNMVIESSHERNTKSGGCGSGCGGGGCGGMAIEGSKAGIAKSSGCGSGCGGSCSGMVAEGSKTGHAKSGGFCHASTRGSQCVVKHNYRGATWFRNPMFHEYILRIGAPAILYDCDREQLRVVLMLQNENFEQEFTQDDLKQECRRPRKRNPESDLAQGPSWCRSTAAIQSPDTPFAE